MEAGVSVRVVCIQHFLYLRPLPQGHKSFLPVSTICHHPSYEPEQLAAALCQIAGRGWGSVPIYAVDRSELLL